MSEAMNDAVVWHVLMQPFVKTATGRVSFAASFITVSGEGKDTIIISLQKALRSPQSSPNKWNASLDCLWSLDFSMSEV
jgi:hypothetical protein